MAKRGRPRAIEREHEPDPTLIEKPAVVVRAKQLVNTSGKVQNFPGMGAKAVKPGGSIDIPKDPAHVRFLKNHGFELAGK